MKCDDFLPLLATGGWLGRWRARRHARHCSRCAVAASLLRELKAERSDGPVPVELRQAWLAAAGPERPSRAALPARPRASLRRLGLVAAPCAVVFLIVLCFVMARRQAGSVALKAPEQSNTAGDPPATSARPPAPDGGAVALMEIDPAQQLAWLEERVVELASDMEKLAVVSRKREIEGQIEALLASHADWQRRVAATGEQAIP